MAVHGWPDPENRRFDSADEGSLTINGGPLSEMIRAVTRPFAISRFREQQKNTDASTHWSTTLQNSTPP